MSAPPPPTSTGVSPATRDYYVLDADDRIVLASGGCAWMRKFLGHVVWECMPLAEIIFRPRFEEARRAEQRVEFRVFYAGALSEVAVVPSGTSLTVFVAHLERLNVRTLATLIASLHRIEAALAARAPEQRDRPAHGSLQALP